MSDFRLELHIKNARLYRAIMNRHRSVREFCTMCGVGYSMVSQFMALRLSPFGLHGDYKDSAKKVAEAIGENVEDIFPEHVYRRLLRRSLVAYTERDQIESTQMKLLEHETQDGIREKLASVMETLHGREAEILRMRYGMDGRPEMTIDEVANAYDLSKERIRQIEAVALRRLRHPSRAKVLWDSIETYDVLEDNVKQGLEA